MAIRESRKNARRAPTIDTSRPSQVTSVVLAKLKGVERAIGLDRQAQLRMFSILDLDDVVWYDESATLQAWH